MEGPPLGSGGEDITWPDQVAPRGRKASGTCKIKPQTSKLIVFLLCTLLHHLSLCPVLSPCSPFLSLVACTSCCLRALLVSSPLCLPFAPCPLRKHARTFCFFRPRTQAPLPTHALCHLLFLVPCSLVPLFHLLPCFFSLSYGTLATFSLSPLLVRLIIILAFMQSCLMLFTYFLVGLWTPCTRLDNLMHS